MPSTAEYMREYRATHSRYREHNRKRIRARRAAERALARKFPAQFNELFAAELAKAGIYGEERSGRKAGPLWAGESLNLGL